MVKGRALGMYLVYNTKLRVRQLWVAAALSPTPTTVMGQGHSATEPVT